MTTEAEVYEALKYRIEVDEFGTHIYRNAAGQPHRDNGPAVVDADGTSAWYQNGLLHCVAGPAVVWADGGSAWWFKGVRHRTDGPAAEHANGIKEWWLKGVQYTEQGYHAQLKALGQTP